MTDLKDFLPRSHFTVPASGVKARVKTVIYFHSCQYFFFFANLAKSDAIQEVNCFIKW